MRPSPWIEAIFEPAGMVLLLASVVSGLLAAWWLFPIGLLLWALIFLRVMLDPSLRLQMVVSKRVGLSPRFQTQFNQIQKIQIQIFNSIFSSRVGIQRTLQPLQNTINQLMDLVYQLCVRMTPMENLRIISPSEDKLRQELEMVNTQIVAANDPVTQKGLEESNRTILIRLQQLKDIRQKLDRFDAQLMGLENRLQSMLAEVVKLQAADPRFADESARVLVEQLKVEMEQLKSFS